MNIFTNVRHSTLRFTQESINFVCERLAQRAKKRVSIYHKYILYINQHWIRSITHTLTVLCAAYIETGERCLDPECVLIRTIEISKNYEYVHAWSGKDAFSAFIISQEPASAHTMSIPHQHLLVISIENDDSNEEYENVNTSTNVLIYTNLRGRDKIPEKKLKSRIKLIWFRSKIAFVS